MTEAQCERMQPSPVLCCLCYPVSEFIRVPAKSSHPAATVRGLTADYQAHELGALPLAAQIMGSSKDLLVAAAAHLVQVKGAPRIDLNCGEGGFNTGYQWHQDPALRWQRLLAASVMHPYIAPACCAVWCCPPLS